MMHRSLKFPIFLTALLLSFGRVLAQNLPPVGVIDLYGLRGRVKAADVMSTMTIKIGDDAKAAMIAKADDEKRLRAMPGVTGASISVVCCDDGGKTMIFVGVQEVGQPSLVFRTAPKGAVRLNEEVVQAGKEFDDAFIAAAGENNFGEDDSQGHALFAEPKIRAIQEHFPALANKDLVLLRKVIRESSDAKHRALAAEVIAYYKNKKAVVDDLIYAVTDLDTTVRNNATRALIVIANYARSKPELGISIPGESFVKMLNSLDWTDRNKAIGVLFAITAQPDTKLFANLKANALPALSEMAMWKNPGHSMTAFVVLGRVSGMPHDDIMTAWRSNDRAASVRAIVEKIQKQK